MRRRTCFEDGTSRSHSIFRHSTPKSPPSHICSRCSSNPTLPRICPNPPSDQPSRVLPFTDSTSGWLPSTSSFPCGAITHCCHYYPDLAPETHATIGHSDFYFYAFRAAYLLRRGSRSKLLRGNACGVIIPIRQGALIPSGVPQHFRAREEDSGHSHTLTN